MINFRRIMNGTDGSYNKTEKQFESVQELDRYVAANYPNIREKKWQFDEEKKSYFYHDCSSENRVYEYVVWATA